MVESSSRLISVTNIVEVATLLWHGGLNVIPTAPDKRPTVPWRKGAEEGLRYIEDEKHIRKLFGTATNVAVAGGCYGGSGDCYVGIDFDDPIAIEKLRAWISKLCSDESSLCVLTGPRPKGDIKCEECKGPFDLDCLCQGGQLSEPKPLRELPRGVSVFIQVPRECAPKKSFMSGVVDILFHNYQLVYGPTMYGSWYTPFRVIDGEVKPVDWLKQLKVPTGGRLTCDEFKSLLQDIGAVIGVNDLEKRVLEVAQGTQEHGVSSVSSAPDFRRLTEDEKTRLRELLVRTWKPGFRDKLLFSIAGWATKAKPKPIDPLDLASVILDVMGITNDRDDPRQRLGVILDTYVKAGFNINADYFAPLGIRPYGPYADTKPEQVKGYTGVSEALKAMGLRDEDAFDTLTELEELFGTKPPHKRDTLWAKISDNPRAYFIANYDTMEIYKLKKNKYNVWVVDRLITEGVPTEIEIYRSPYGGPTLFKITWEAKTLSRPLVLGPATLEDIERRLINEGLVKARQLLSDALSSLINEAIKAGRAIEKFEAPAPGFYYDSDGKLRAYGLDVKPPTTEELRRALEALNALHDAYIHIEDVFLKVVKYGLVAPYAYAIKERHNNFLPGLYIWGATHTTKTTLAKIAVALYAQDPSGPATFTSGAGVDTVAKLGKKFEESTLPLIIDEAPSIFEKLEIIEMLKSSLTSTIARARHETGQYRIIPALRTPIFTGNRAPPLDDALLRRLVIIYLSYRFKVPEEKKEEFNKSLLPRIRELHAIGRFIASRLIELGKLPDNPWDVVKLLPEAYKTAGLETPDWVSKLVSIELSTEEGLEDAYRDIEEQVRSVILRSIVDAYTRYVGKLPEAQLNRNTLREAVVKTAGVVPWLMVRARDEIMDPTSQVNEEATDVYLLPGLMDELERAGVVGSLGGLKSIAELLNWEYIPKLSIRVAERTTSRAVIRTTLRRFLDFLLPNIGDS
jgi:hypothetical protein